MYGCLDLIEAYVNHFTWCDEKKTATAAKTPIHPCSRPWAMDHAWSVKINDAHSKWVEAGVVKLISVEPTIAVLRSVLSVHELLVSDNASGFTTSLGIHHRFSALCHLATNCLSEHARNASIKLPITLFLFALKSFLLCSNYAWISWFFYSQNQWIQVINDKSQQCMNWLILKL